MYGHQFMPGQVYGQPGMMPYVPGMVQPPMVPGYTGAPDYRGTFSPNMSRQLPPPPPPPPPPMPQQGHEPHDHAMPPQTQPHPRNNEIGTTSSVIHLRNVTPEVTQLSIQNLAQNFGDIKHIVMLRQMNQALIEMKNTKSAEQLVDFFKEPGYAEIDGRRVYIRYSNHQTLTATQHVSRTLLVSMFNTQYDVSAAAHITPEIVYQIFANYGAVERIVVLPKNESSQWNHNRVQALVQFGTRESAEHVKNILQGQPVTLGDTVTFTLDIQFSRMDEIKTTNPATSLVIDDDGVHRPPGNAVDMDAVMMQAPMAAYPYVGWS
ncbi:putative RNA-binding protein [Leptomonas pyrrhocoris]|uniref:Putative RNA-binding protein n=1 Tax=Leptomonas pyrrhocoris TaxID=157538 RepID=A0A0M9FTC8_LEPPY|nr:putative RNA-binding protein [Leptomonas pyrrhocoris]KPA75623.1 putative RNA-binding protein [Leptomonas pyrrhocoris]|eukprot:XP_015654062.1 putative RNA-binding protein [Leptomonas pyrrhocoris]